MAGGRIPDLVVRFASTPGQRVLVDTKLWSQPTLDKVLNDRLRFDKLVAQVQGYLSDPSDRALIEFVATQGTSITSLDALRQALAQRNVDVARVALRIVGQLLEAPANPF